MADKKSLAEVSLEALLAELSEIYKAPDKVKGEYLLVQKGQQYNEPITEYRRIFEVYSELQKQSHWTSYFNRITRFIQACGFIVIVVTAVKFSWDARDRQRQHLFENWDVVALTSSANTNKNRSNTNKNKSNVDQLNSDIIAVGRGRKDALEYLHDRGENLSRLNAQDAVLPLLNFPETTKRTAQLQEANFQHAMLFSAYFVKANLYQSNFENAQLSHVNFTKANLMYANFKDSDLQYACFRGADLKDALFDNKSNFEGTDFRGAKNLDKEVIRKAMNYKRAIYDKGFMPEPGLLTDPTELPSNFLAKKAAGQDFHGCDVKPRAKSWWESLFKKDE